MKLVPLLSAGLGLLALLTPGAAAFPGTTTNEDAVLGPGYSASREIESALRGIEALADELTDTLYFPGGADASDPEDLVAYFVRLEDRDDGRYLLFAYPYCWELIEFREGIPPIWINDGSDPENPSCFMPLPLP